MSARTLADYRSVQIDIRAIELSLGFINDEEKTHPDKATGYDSLEKRSKWDKVRGEFDRRRAYLRKQLARKEEEKATLFESLSRTPLPMTSMADVINKLTYIESLFTSGIEKPWDAVSDYIDTLESDQARVKGLKAA